VGEDVLTEVIKAEKEVQDWLAGKREVAAQILAEAENAAMDDVLMAEKELKETYQKSLLEANLQARQKALQILDASERLTEKLRKLDEDTIRRVLSKHIRRILPGVQA
jgi:vacuolar-type H+-ATPase subunit H